MKTWYIKRPSWGNRDFRQDRKMIGIETDITHLSNESLLYCLEQAIMRAEVTSGLAILVMSEVIARGLIE